MAQLFHSDLDPQPPKLPGSEGQGPWEHQGSSVALGPGWAEDGWWLPSCAGNFLEQWQCSSSLHAGRSGVGLGNGPWTEPRDKLLGPGQLLRA